MTLKEIFNILNVESNIPNTVIKKIKTDSKKIEKGDIFIALIGKKYNGNKYAKEAIEKGAVISIVDEDVDDLRCIKVKNTYDALAKIGNYIRCKYNIPLIAITGSNGKTTTKELIVHILKSRYNVLYNKDNKNNIIGVSETLFNFNKKIDISVMELGSNHFGEISLLSKMCEPTMSVITNIGTAHLKYFKTRKNIFKEKISILDGMKEKELITNGDDKFLKKLQYFKCGINENNNLKAYDIKTYLNKVCFKIKLDKEYYIEFNNPGSHFIVDVLLAIKVCMKYVDLKTIIKRIKTFKLLNKRMEIIKLKNNILINDCYNSSYESVLAGINYLKSIKKDKLLILGDMLELGRYSFFIHKKINKLIDDSMEVLTVGHYTKYIKGKHFNDVDTLVEYLKSNRLCNKYIYVKGSRKMNLDKVTEYIQRNE